MASNQPTRNSGTAQAMDAEDHSVQGAPHRLLRDTTEDRVVTGILHAAERYTASRRVWNDQGRKPAAVSHGDDPGISSGVIQGVIAITDAIERLLAREPDIAEIITSLPEAFGEGEMLKFLFQNVYPGNRLRPVRVGDGGSILTPRETEILTDAAGGESNAQIANRLFITERTVTTHLHNAYGKLGVSTLVQAVARASLLGYISIDAPAMLLGALQREPSAHTAFRSFCLKVGTVHPLLSREEVPSITAFGLFLVALGAAAARQQHGDTPARSAERGGVCRLLPNGDVSGPFGVEQMGIARCLAIAPDHASRQGFRPGNLFVGHDLVPQEGLSRSAVSEFTPDGQCVRCFRGGDNVTTRLIGTTTLAFAADGRLLVTSGWLTDGILAFSRGGKEVTRFVDGTFLHVAVGPTGEVYASNEDAARDGRIYVFSPRGELVRHFGRKRSGVRYHGLAVDNRGHIYATRALQGRRTIDEFDPRGAILNTFRMPDGSDDRIAIDGNDQLYMPLATRGSVEVVSLDSGDRRSINLYGQLAPTCVAAGEDGTVWIGGKLPGRP